MDISVDTLFDNLKNVLQTYFPIKVGDKELILENIESDLSLAKKENIRLLTEIKDKGSSFVTPVYGTFVLKTPAGEKRERVKLFSLPLPTKFNTFIIDGNEYNILNQLRLRPGVFTRLRPDGEIETHMNFTTGWQFKLFFKDGNIILKVGTRAFPIYSILKGLGVEDNEIRSIVGDKIFEKMIKEHDETAPEELAKLISRDYSSNLPQVLNNFKVDPNITRLTIGQEFGNANKDLLIAALKDFIKTTKGEKEAINRDSFLFKEFRNAEDLFAERLEFLKSRLLGKIRRNLTVKDNIRQIVGTHIFNEPIRSIFSQLALVNYSKQTNPLRIINNAHRTTLLGEGGIQSEYALSLNARAMDPSFLGIIDPLHLPQSDAVGAVQFLTVSAKKEGNILKGEFIDKLGNKHYLSAQEAFNKNIAFPDEIEYIDGKIKFKDPDNVRVQREGKILTVNAKDVDYIVPGVKSFFSFSSSLIPFLKHTHPARASMSSALMEQAVSLKDPEPPKLRAVDHFLKTSSDKLFADKFNIYAPFSGKITKITPNEIFIDASPVPIYNYYPINEGYIHSNVRVKVGDYVKKGDLLADSNFTRDNRLALGKNLLVAFIPYKGLNFEDAIVISESAAKKLTSTHLYPFSLDIHSKIVLSKRKYDLLYPGRFSPKQLEKLDEDGVIKENETVDENDPLIIALEERQVTPQDAILMKISRSLFKPFDPVDTTWPYSFQGIVKRVVKTPSKITVYVYTEAPAQVGDKLINRFANKGIISMIVPDSEMPRTEDGQIIDVALNPLGVITRMNLGQLYELGVDKDTEINALESAKIKPKTRTLIDPITGKKLKNVLVGNQYIMKLEHMVTEKSSARYIDGYDSDLQPAKGGEEGAKAMDALTVYSLLSHGARANLEEMATFKAEKNTDAWNIFETGGTLPPPKPTFAFMKFLGLLKAAGINVEQRGVFFKPMPLIDKHTEQLSVGEIKTPKLLVAGRIAEERGGLFDPILTGGLKGEKWTHITLSEPILNPMFEKVVAQLMNVSQSTLRRVIAGQEYYNNKTGIDAIKDFLSKIDIDREIEKLKQESKDVPLDELDNINRKIRFLLNLKRTNIKPEELIITKIPVLPPIMRPVYPKSMENRISPFNILYRDIALINDSLKDLKDVPFEAKKEIYNNLYNSVKALYGLTDPISSYYSERKPQGILSYIAGPNPKEGFFQSKLLSRKQDVVGRSTIIPDNSLTIDELGVPETIAWKIFAPFVMRELVATGMSALEAAKHLDEKSDVAKRILDVVASKRFVLANRAPSLYKFNIMAFKPKIVSGEAIRVNPLVVSAFGGDFDGDTFTIHTPISTDANNEASTMLPSRVFLNPRNSKFMFLPSMEAIIGLNTLSQRITPQSIKRYNNLAEIERDIYANKLEPNEEIILNNKRTTYGQEIINALLPEKYRDYNREITKKELEKLLIQIFKEDPTVGANLVNNLNNLGTKWAYLTGFSIKPEDLTPKKFDVKKIPKTDNLDKIVSTIEQDLLKDKKNSLVKMVLSGARGNPEQLRQILIGPIVLSDHTDRVYPHIFDKSYAEGLPAWQYWLAIAPARKGIIDKKVSVSEPGELSKEMIALMNDYFITEEDCKTRNGKILPLNEAADFALAEDIIVDNQKVLARNTFLTPEKLAVLEKYKIKEVKVRVPLTCEARAGVCIICAGLNEYGEKYRKGQYIGITTAQALSEPATQLALKSVHVGLGLNIGGFKKLQYLLEAPKTSILRTPIADIDGIVTKIDKDPHGNNVITITNETTREQNIYISKLKPKVSLKEKVTRGDPLFYGIPHPEDVYKVLGLEKLKEYYFKSLKDFYDEQNIRTHPRHFFLITKALTNYGIVVDPKNSPFVPGDPVRLNAITDKVYISIDEAAGEKLAEDITHIDSKYKKGYTLTDEDVDFLAKQGYASVAVIADKPHVEPIIKGLEGLALLKTDWLERMTFRNLKSTVQEAAIRGWTSNLKGYSPLPAYIYGPAIKEHAK